MTEILKNDRNFEKKYFHFEMLRIYFFGCITVLVAYHLHSTAIALKRATQNLRFSKNQG